MLLALSSVPVAQSTAEAPAAQSSEIYVLTARPLAGPRADVAALLLGGKDSGSLAALALAVPVSTARGIGVDFWIELDGEPLLDIDHAESTRPDVLRLELYAYALTRSGELVGHLSRRVRIPVERLGEALSAGGVLLTGRLEIEAVEVQLRLLVREPGSQRFALRVLQVDGPSEHAAETKLPEELARLSPETGEAWIVRRAMPPTPVTASSVAEAALLVAPPRGPEPEQRRGASHRVAAIARSYQVVLDRLAAGATTTAVTELVELEAGVLAESARGRPAISSLTSGEEKVVKQLAGHDPESLLPVLFLHLEAHERYLTTAGTSAYLLGAARQRILGLAQGYASLTETEMASELAASALAELGMALDRAGLPMAAQRMLQEALRLDDSHVAALLYLAYWHERRGAYRDTVPLFRRLLAVDPRSQQGRLRLALALRRLDESDEASRLLRQVIDDGARDELLTIAYQELGRLLMARGDHAEASRLLEAAISRLPGQQRLYLQLAYALDRSGESRRGREIIAALPAATGQLSPRNVYSRRPAAGDSRFRAVLARHATARLPRLAQALAAIGDGR